ncbi:unnamed protein product [Pedinophyceae sp. YPF-701]|nr:unnamed protein product [Pedinophyceae sp. YPF-701]
MQGIADLERGQAAHGPSSGPNKRKPGCAVLCVGVLVVIAGKAVVARRAAAEFPPGVIPEQKQCEGLECFVPAPKRLPEPQTQKRRLGRGLSRALKQATTVMVSISVEFVAESEAFAAAIAVEARDSFSGAVLARDAAAVPAAVATTSGNTSPRTATTSVALANVAACGSAVDVVLTAAATSAPSSAGSGAVIARQELFVSCQGGVSAPATVPAALATRVGATAATAAFSECYDGSPCPVAASGATMTLLSGSNVGTDTTSAPGAWGAVTADAQGGAVLPTFSTASLRLVLPTGLAAPTHLAQPVAMPRQQPFGSFAPAVTVSPPLTARALCDGSAAAPRTLAVSADGSGAVVPAAVDAIDANSPPVYVPGMTCVWRVDASQHRPDAARSTVWAIDGRGLAQGASVTMRADGASAAAVSVQAGSGAEVRYADAAGVATVLTFEAAAGAAVGNGFAAAARRGSLTTTVTTEEIAQSTWGGGRVAILVCLIAAGLSYAFAAVIGWRHWKRNTRWRRLERDNDWEAQLHMFFANFQYEVDYGQEGPEGDAEAKRQGLSDRQVAFLLDPAIQDALGATSLPRIAAQYKPREPPGVVGKAVSAAAAAVGKPGGGKPGDEDDADDEDDDLACTICLDEISELKEAVEKGSWQACSAAARCRKEVALKARDVEQGSRGAQGDLHVPSNTEQASQRSFTDQAALLGGDGAGESASGAAMSAPQLDGPAGQDGGGEAAVSTRGGNGADRKADAQAREAAKMDESLVWLTCGHAFHRRCIVMWMRKMAVCPLCKDDVRKGIQSQGYVPTAEEMLRAEQAGAWRLAARDAAGSARSVGDGVPKTPLRGVPGSFGEVGSWREHPGSASAQESWRATAGTSRAESARVGGPRVPRSVLTVGVRGGGVSEPAVVMTDAANTPASPDVGTWRVLTSVGSRGEGDASAPALVHQGSIEDRPGSRGEPAAVWSPVAPRRQAAPSSRPPGTWRTASQRDRESLLRGMSSTLLDVNAADFEDPDSDSDAPASRSAVRVSTSLMPVEEGDSVGDSEDLASRRNTSDQVAEHPPRPSNAPRASTTLMRVTTASSARDSDEGERGPERSVLTGTASATHLSLVVATTVAPSSTASLDDSRSQPWRASEGVSVLDDRGGAAPRLEGRADAVSTDDAARRDGAPWRASEPPGTQDADWRRSLGAASTTQLRVIAEDDEITPLPPGPIQDSPETPPRADAQDAPREAPPVPSDSAAAPSSAAPNGAAAAQGDASAHATYGATARSSVPPEPGAWRRSTEPVASKPPVKSWREVARKEAAAPQEEVPPSPPDILPPPQGRRRRRSLGPPDEAGEIVPHVPAAPRPKWARAPEVKNTKTKEADRPRNRSENASEETAGAQGGAAGAQPAWKAFVVKTTTAPQVWAGKRGGE